MSASLDDDVVQRVNDLGSIRWNGTVYRHTAGRRDPLSGAGARINGGRWNPKGIFATLYLAEPVTTCLQELDRLAATQGVDATTLLAVPRRLHTITATNVGILDLRTDDALDQVGLRLDDIHDPDWTACQTVGHAAWFLELTGIIAPSATGHGNVVALFESRIQPDQLTVGHSEILDSDLYATLRGRR